MVRSKVQTLTLADQTRVTVNQQVEAISITLVHLIVRIGGLVCPNLSMVIITGLDWLQKLKTTIVWDTSTLTVNRVGVNFNIFPNGMYHILKDYVLVKVVKTKWSTEKTGNTVSSTGYISTMSWLNRNTMTLG